MLAQSLCFWGPVPFRLTHYFAQVQFWGPSENWAIVTSNYSACLASSTFSVLSACQAPFASRNSLFASKQHHTVTSKDHWMQKINHWSGEILVNFSHSSCTSQNLHLCVIKPLEHIEEPFPYHFGTLHSFASSHSSTPCSHWILPASTICSLPPFYS